ncbi:MAG: glycoside hydrolase family 5 protein [Ruminococcus sp.]|nr:glycoside hydrolase family 5 protein [Ruminococcus sp.]
MKKRIVSALLCAVMLMSTACGSSDDTSSAQAKKNTKPMSAAEVADNMNLGINLGNTMEAYDASGCEKITYEWIPTKGSNKPKDYETCWGAVETTQKVIDGMKKAGFDTVRIPVFWGNMMENDGSWKINEEYIKRVKEIVDYAQKADMYTVINCHHFDEFIIRRNSLEDCKTIFNNLWTQIADYFKDYPYTLVFEGFNEYLGGDQFDENGDLKPLASRDAYTLVNELNQTFVDAVRATGGNNKDRVLIVSGYWTNIDKTTSKNFKMPTDSAQDKLMVSVHYVDNEKYWTNQIGSQEWLDYIDKQCEELTEAFKDKNIPVFLGETTSIYPESNFDSNALYTDSSECLQIVLDKLTGLGYVPVLWDVNDNFYSRTEYKVKNDADAEVIKNTAEKLR